MSEAIIIVILTLGSGSCMVLGGLIATAARFQKRWLEQEVRHFVIAMGGGILMGAVALVLIPEGVEFLHHSLVSVPLVLFGGVLFFLIEKKLGRSKRESPQLMGMLLDFIPEVIALGGMFAASNSKAILLAVLIGLQNLPEGFNSFRELRTTEPNNAIKILLIMSALALLGPAAGLIGYYFLAENKPVLGAIMLIASGGVLYLMFQDIAPQSKLKNHWAPPLGAVVGFCVAMLSSMIVG